MRAGAALRDITPYDRAVSLPGHARRGALSEGVASPLHVRVLALDDGVTRVLIAVSDCLWWPSESTADARRTIASTLELPAGAVILHATHTHTAPQPGTGFAPHLGAPDLAFLASMVDAVIDAGREAIESLRTVTLERATTSHRIGVHRRRTVDGEVRFAPDPDVAVDDRVRIARLSAGGQTVATLVHYACHPTTTGENLVSSDWPGVLARTVDASAGGVTLLLQGCAGDVRPDLSLDGAFVPGTDGDVVRLGSGLAGAVAAALPGTAGDWSPLSWRERTVDLRLEDGTGVPMSALGLQAGWSLVWLGCEPVGRFQQAAPDAWVMGYTNGMVGYVTTAAQREAGGYEPLGSLDAFGLSAPFDRSTEATVVGVITELAGP